MDQLDMLVGDFSAHIKRLTALDHDGVINVDVVAELRDNAYPSLLILAEAMRDLDAEIAELLAPTPNLTPQQALALAAALRSGQMLAAAVREASCEIDAKTTRDALGIDADEFDAAARIAVAVLHGVVAVDDEPDVGAGGEL